MLAAKKQTEFGRVLILGAGATGLSCVRYLQQRTEQLSLADSREQPPGFAQLKGQYPNLSLHGGGFKPKLLEGLDTLVLSPGVSRFDPLVQRALETGIEVIGDVELFARVCVAPVIAITGSNGKSTVTTLVAEMGAKSGIKVEAGANLGEPALELLAKPAPDYYVLELSSFQLENLLSLKPQAAALLDISADHMDRYRDLDHYAATKMRILRCSKLVVLNRDDPYFERCRASLAPSQELVTIGLSAPENDQEYGLSRSSDGLYLCLGKQKLIEGNKLKLFGQHNLLNVMAALALANNMQIPRSESLASAMGFSGLAHRMQMVAEFGRVDWFDDSKATNSAACQSAIASLAADQGMNGGTGKIVLIAGGDAKGQDFNDLAQKTSPHIRALIVLGKDGRQIAEAYRPYLIAQQIHCLEAESMAEPVALAARIALSDDAVLLAPACSSQDMYLDYRQRGEDFQRAVKAQGLMDAEGGSEL